MQANTKPFARKAILLSLIAILLVVFTTLPVSAASKKPKKITLTTTTKTIDIKGKTTVKVKSVSPSKASKAVTWKSSNKKIATVSSKGVVTGKKAGKVKITATSKKNKRVKKTITITVKNLKATSISLNQTKANLAPGDKLTLKATVKYPKGFYNEGVTWKSSDTSVATVSTKGLVTAVAPGTATVTVTDKSSKKTAKATINVVELEKAIVVYLSRGENMVDASGYYAELTADKSGDAAMDALTGASVLQAEDGELTGNVGVLAKWIAGSMDLDIYSIKVTDLPDADLYNSEIDTTTSYYSEANSPIKNGKYPNTKRATQNYMRNYEKGQNPSVESCDIDFSQYDVIYFGWPNLDGNLPRAIRQFIKENNLDGKKIIPFTVYENSTSGIYNGFDGSITDLEGALPRATILEGNAEYLYRKDLYKNGEYNAATKAAVQKWAKSTLMTATLTAPKEYVETSTGDLEKARSLMNTELTLAEFIEQVGEPLNEPQVKSIDCGNHTSITLNYTEFSVILVAMTKPSRYKETTKLTVNSIDLVN